MLSVPRAPASAARLPRRFWLHTLRRARPKMQHSVPFAWSAGQPFQWRAGGPISAVGPRWIRQRTNDRTARNLRRWTKTSARSHHPWHLAPHGSYGSDDSHSTPRKFMWHPTIPLSTSLGCSVIISGDGLSAREAAWPVIGDRGAAANHRQDHALVVPFQLSAAITTGGPRRLWVHCVLLRNRQAAVLATEHGCQAAPS